VHNYGNDEELRKQYQEFLEKKKTVHLEVVNQRENKNAVNAQE